MIRFDDSIHIRTSSNCDICGTALLAELHQWKRRGYTREKFYIYCPNDSRHIKAWCNAWDIDRPPNLWKWDWDKAECPVCGEELDVKQCQTEKGRIYWQIKCVEDVRHFQGFINSLEYAEIYPRQDGE